jgi:hypothetical protein
MNTFTRFLFITSLVIFCAQKSHSQQYHEDFILLKNSDLLRGEITKSEEGDYVLIMLADSSFQRVDQKEIFKIGKAEKGVSGGQIRNQSYKPKVGSSFHFIIEPGIGFASYNDSPASLGKLTLIPSIAFGEQFSFGIATGIRFPLAERYPIIPLAADFRITGTSRVAPILVLGAGTSVLPEQNYDGNGVIFYGMGGVNIKSFRGGSVALMAGVDIGEQRVDQEISAPFGGTFTGSGSETVTAFVVGLAFTL